MCLSMWRKLACHWVLSTQSLEKAAVLVWCLKHAGAANGEDMRMSQVVCVAAPAGLGKAATAQLPG